MDVRKIWLREGPVLGLCIDGDDVLACITQKSVNN
jgi:hypothetical protein